MEPLAAKELVKGLTDVVKAQLDNVRSAQESVSASQQETMSRLATLEQVVATGKARGDGVSASGVPNVAAHAFQALQDLPGFSELKDWNNCTVRARLSGGVRLALTNTPYEPSSDGAYIPSRPDRSGIYGPVARPLRLLDVLPSRPTTSDAVEYVQLTATGDAAEQVKEGDTKAEIKFEGELKRAEIATIAGWSPASRQVLSDHAALQSIIGTVLTTKVLDRLENQLVNGPGGQGKIHGLMDLGTQFIPVISSSPADVIGEAVSALANYGYQPNAILMHPTDWLGIQVTKDLEGGYLFGSPTLPAPAVLWNQPVVLTKSMPRGKCVVLDTAYVTVLDREQPSVMLSNSHADFFVRNLVAILGEMRAGLEVRDTRAVFVMDLEYSSEVSS